MKQKMYEIVSDLLVILDDTDPETGELRPDAEQLLELFEMDLHQKVDNVCRFIRESEAEANGFKSEADRLAGLASTAARKVERLKRYVKDQMERGGMTKLETELFKLAIQRNSAGSVRLQDGAPIPDDFARVTRELDRTKVLETVKGGGALPPTITIEHGTHLRIR